MGPSGATRGRAGEQEDAAQGCAGGLALDAQPLIHVLLPSRFSNRRQLTATARVSERANVRHREWRHPLVPE
ncbi:hypothetical protein AAFF_G00132810 [Aldrovandia affinis]|uniref:Uncharacterized protein n=1 Tax=Aldrovandia affinis TaxID=143900 RepID=A0AAD7RQY7_9TELE|nr:hypothetical protein AAFF_G00132810 [Aldrovandia affinis]